MTRMINEPQSRNGKDTDLSPCPVSLDGAAEPAECDCVSCYSVEPGDNGYAVYFGMCRHKKGWHVCTISDVQSLQTIRIIETALNQYLLRR